MSASIAHAARGGCRDAATARKVYKACQPALQPDPQTFDARTDADADADAF